MVYLAERIAPSAVGSYPAFSTLPDDRCYQAVCFLWHCHLDCSSQTLSGALFPWSPDFPHRLNKSCGAAIRLPVCKAYTHYRYFASALSLLPTRKKNNKARRIFRVALTCYDLSPSFKKNIKKIYSFLIFFTLRKPLSSKALDTAAHFPLEQKKNS